jgi:mycothiol synthase
MVPPLVPSPYRLRPPRRKDAGAVTAVLRAIDLQQYGESDTSREEVLEEWALPRLDLERDAWLLEGDRDELAAYGFFWMEGPPSEAVAAQAVHPQHRGRGLTEALLRLGEARAADEARHSGVPVALGVWGPAGDTARLALFERLGYKRRRTFLRLVAGLGEPPAAPQWPPGITVRPFRRSHDERAVWAASVEAFRDHFRPSAMDLDEWTAFRFARSDLDLGLWTVAWAGDEVAGAILSDVLTDGDMGYVDELFVRRPWRGRGLGRALLLTALAALCERGLQRACLGVDDANPTGAMRLYTSVGMEPSRETVFLDRTILPPASGPRP